MKKGLLSVWGLMARATLPLTLLICVLLTVSDAVLFPLQSAGATRLDTAFTDSAVMVVFVISLAVFCLRGALGAQHTMPFSRLGISDRAQFGLLAVQMALCLLILWAWQAGVALFLALWWERLHPEMIGQHTLLLATYRVSFLHALLPMGDWLLWVRNVVLCAALGVCAAKAALTRRIGGAMVIGILAALFWPTRDSSRGFVLIQIAILAAAGGLAWMAGKGALHEEQT